MSPQSLSSTRVTQVPSPAAALPPPQPLHVGGVLTCAVPTSGYGGLSLSIEGPSKVDINTEDQEDGTCKVTYCPTEPGNYIINIKFADQHVPGAHWVLVWDQIDHQVFLCPCVPDRSQ